jgi:hypothetical protein
MLHQRGTSEAAISVFKLRKVQRCLPVLQATLYAHKNAEADVAARPAASVAEKRSAFPASQPFTDLAESREDAELQQRELSERHGLPKTIEGFRKHPLYVLERHISRYQSLMPGTAKLGLHRGEAYYDRSRLADLHSAERWRREGREVLPEELSQAAKVVKQRAAKGSKAGRSSLAVIRENAAQEGECSRGKV